MSRGMDRHRIKNKYSQGLDALSGDAPSDQAKTYSDLISTLAKAGGEIASTQLKNKEGAAASKEANDARTAAQEARKKASMAAADALTEADPNGPKHKAAAEANLAANAAEAKAAYYNQPGSGAQGQSMMIERKSQGLPSWLPWVVGGLGVVVVGAIGYRLVKGSGEPAPRRR